MNNYPPGVTTADIDRAAGELNEYCEHLCLACRQAVAVSHERVDVDEDGLHEIRCDFYWKPEETYCRDCYDELLDAAEAIGKGVTDV